MPGKTLYSWKMKTASSSTMHFKNTKASITTKQLSLNEYNTSWSKIIWIIITIQNYQNLSMFVLTYQNVI